MENLSNIIDIVAHEKGIAPQAVYKVVKEELIKLAQSEINPDFEYFVEQDAATNTLKLFHKLIVCADDDQNAQNTAKYICISKLQGLDVSIGDELEQEINLEQISKSAVNRIFLNLETALQRQLEEQILDALRAKLNSLVSGVVIAVDDDENTYIEIEGVRAVLAKRHRIKGESFKVGQTMRALVKFVGCSKNGIKIELSRTAPRFLEELMRLEVPELKDGNIEIYRSARIPGERAKMAVWTKSSKIDPIGCCVGVKGVRINSVSAELKGENIDCIEYTTNPEMFIARALSPAQVLSVKIKKPEDEQSVESGEQNLDSESEISESSGKSDKKNPVAIVQITSDQKSKAIGKSGVNIRLASMITGYDIELIEKDGVSAQGADGGNGASGGVGITGTGAQKNGIDALESLFKK